MGQQSIKSCLTGFISISRLNFVIKKVKPLIEIMSAMNSHRATPFYLLKIENKMKALEDFYLIQGLYYVKQ